MEKIFAECLKPFGNVRMWRFYLKYVLLCNAPGTGIDCERSAIEGNVEEKEQISRQTISKAYELALGSVGTDYGAMPIYRDYLNFVTDWKCNSLYEQQVQMDNTRKIYHRALIVPMDGLEALWGSYDTYENGLNKLTAKKMLADKSPAYMTARSAARELQLILTRLDRDDYALDPQEMPQEMAAWKFEEWNGWVEWEKKNTLILPPAALHQRIVYSYKVSLSVALRLFPEAWFNYSRYLISIGKKDEAEGILRSATEILPASSLIAFALIDLIEPTTPPVDASATSEPDKKVTECKVIFEKLIETSQTRIDQPSLDATGQVKLDEDQDEEACRQQSKWTEQYSLAWINYMNWSRRVEGINGARAVFSRCRKLTSINHAVFIAAAKMEYFCKRDFSIASKIFELGMGRFASNGEYVLEYLRHLLQSNDEQNSRALFERALQSVPPSLALLEIWKCYLEHIFMFGDMATIRQLTTRFQEAYPDQLISHNLSVFSRQYSYNEITPVVDRIWAVLEGNVGSPPIGSRKQLPKPFTIPEAILELGDSLPSPSSYDGPLINPEGLVRLLQVVRPMPDGMPPAMPAAPPVTRPSTRGSARTTTTTSKRRRNRLADDGPERAEPTRNAPRENDLFAQRFHDRNK